MIPLILGCETAAILLGGAGAGSSGGRNQGLDAVERKRDREAEAQRANTEKCFYLLYTISQQRSMLIAEHEQNRSVLKDELQLRLAAASTGAERADAYSRFGDDLPCAAEFSLLPPRSARRGAQ